ncbi:MAG: efflux RND transporter permease subunit [Planctomycetota bacterium]|nr:efflux RND transporter permease subunit [Planctomycetota bacterium]
MSDPRIDRDGPESAGHDRGGVHRILLGRPVLLLVLFACVFVIGGIAIREIPLQMMPDGFSRPGLQIFVSNAGAGAAENEEQVTQPIEEELRTLSGIESIQSSTRQDSVFVWLGFRGDVDMDLAKAEVRDRIERARPKLPSTVDEVGIWSWSQGSMPIAFVAILHDGDSPRNDFLLEEVIQRRIEGVDGVGKVEVWGTLADSLRILLDEDRVIAAGLDLGALIRRLSTDNFAQPLGELEDGGRRILLRSDMRFTSIAEVEDYPIGGGLRVRDVGRVEMVKSVRQQLSRIDGRYSYFAQVEKDSRSNAVDTSRRLREMLKQLEKAPELEGHFQFVTVFDQGEFIENSLSALTSTAVEGGLLAVGILFLFLWRIRLTLLVALSIPFSTLVALAYGYFSGGSFNVLTMMGITLAMGMLVDNSIVVIENITRKKALGLSAGAACSEGAGEVGLAVLLSTLTTVVVFAPLIFLGENPQFRLIFGEIGKPLCVSLLASLLAALVFLPVQARLALGPRPPWLEALATRLAPVGAVPARGVAWVYGGLRAAAHAGLAVLSRVLSMVLALATPLRWVLAVGLVALGAWRTWTALPAFATALASQPYDLAPRGLLLPGATVFLPAAAALLGAALCIFGLPRWKARVAPWRSTTKATIPAGNSIVDFVVGANHALVEWSLRRRLAATGIATVVLLSIAIPATNMKVASFGQDQDSSRINFWVELEENFTLADAESEMGHYEDAVNALRPSWGFSRVLTRFNNQGGRVSIFWDAAPSQSEMEGYRRSLRDALPRIAGHKLQFTDGDGPGSGDKTVVTFRLVGPDSEALEEIGARAVALLEDVPGLSDLRSPLSAAPPQVRLNFDTDVAQQLGLTAQDALQNVSWALRGMQLPRYQEPGREVPFLIEYDEAETAGLGTLRDLNVYTKDSAIPLSSFADLEFGRGQRTIERTDGQASFTIQAKVDSPARQTELSQAGRRALGALDLPRGYEIADESLANVQVEEEMRDIWGALALSVVLVFLLMGILFESFVLPVSVLFTIPFAVVGSYWTLWLTGTAMDSVGWIGIIVLVGVVVNNGIVLVDRITQLRAEGFERGRAVVDACAQRVRPILMTALTSVIGLIPMAMSEPHGEGIDYRALATCVAGGLSASTLFTLWVVPLAYTVIDDLSVALRTQLAWAARRGGRTGEATPESASN